MQRFWGPFSPPYEETKIQDRKSPDNCARLFLLTLRPAFSLACALNPRDDDTFSIKPYLIEIEFLSLLFKISEK